MKVKKNEDKKQILITGCKEKLNFRDIDKVAKREGLEDFAIKEEQLSGESGFIYKVKY